MASFLQNNGDIILDAVLTDYGRRLLAKGDGSFSITKFAFADDEIDYALFDTSGTSTNEDLQIMQTPILEAFTNNAASMKCPLMTLNIDNILFMPIMKLNTLLDSSKTYKYPDIFKGFVVPIDTTISKTTNALTDTNGTFQGVLTSIDKRFITVDQGLDSTKLDPTKNLSTENPMLYESEYNVIIDSRFCSINNNAGGALSPFSIDDDGLAIFKMSEQSVVNNMSYVTQIEYMEEESAKHVIAGTKGSRLQFRIVPSNNLTVDTYFDKYGKEMYLNPGEPTKVFKTLRMPVRIVGVTTGFSLEIPILFAKVES